MGIGRLPVLVAATALVLGAAACAGNEASPNAASDTTAARPAAQDTEKHSSKVSRNLSTSARRADGKGRPSGTAAGSKQRKSPTSTRRAAAAPPSVVTVDDSPSDADADVPGFIEVTGAAVGARDEELTMGITVADAIPDRLSPGEAAMFAFDVEAAQQQFTVVAQLDHNGIAATLNAGDEATPLDHEVEAEGLRISVPWRLLGQDRPSFGWTAGTVLMEITADGVSSRGGDSADAASFPPPPATQDEIDERG